MKTNKRNVTVEILTCVAVIAIAVIGQLKYMLAGTTYRRLAAASWTERTLARFEK